MGDASRWRRRGWGRAGWARMGESALVRVSKHITRPLAAHSVHSPLALSTHILSGLSRAELHTTTSPQVRRQVSWDSQTVSFALAARGASRRDLFSGKRLSRVATLA